MSSKKEFLELNNFKILQHINDASYIKTYLIKDSKTNKDYLAGILADEKDFNQVIIDTLSTEINSCSMLDHPSVLRIFGFSKKNFNNEPSITIITEYANNGSLFEMFENLKTGHSFCCWNPTKKLILIYGIAYGMSYIHSHKIKNICLNPQNIYLDEYFYPKISIFNQWKIKEFFSSNNNDHLRETIKRTPIYTSPEVIINNESNSEANDVYAFAMIIYEIFMLETPFMKSSYIKTIQKIAQGYRPIINDKVPKQFQTIIKQCWSQKPEYRPSFATIVNKIKTREGFIKESIDILEFYNYVEFMERSENIANVSNNNYLCFENFAKKYGISKSIKKVDINKEKSSKVSELKDKKKVSLIIMKNRLIFSLDLNNKTADIIGNSFINGDVFIDRKIKYNDQEFIIKSIKKNAFENVILKSIQFSPYSEIQIIEKNAFQSSILGERVKIPKHVKYIGKNCFNDSNINTLELPLNSDALIIDRNSFSLKIKNILMPSNIILKSGSCNFASVNNIKIIETEGKNIQIYDDKFIITKSNININEYDVLIYASRDIKDVVIPPFIKIIGSYAFSGSLIKSITIPSTIKEIGQYAFKNCRNLMNVKFDPNSQIQILEEGIFQSTSIESISIPESVRDIENNAFYNCNKLRNIELTPDSQLQIINKCAFYMTALNTIIIPPHLTEIYDETFLGCLRNIEFLSGTKLRSINYKSFISSCITSITIPSSVRYIHEEAFSKCYSLKNVNFAPNSEIHTIERNAFYQSSIECIMLPSSIVELRDGWIDFMPNLKRIKIMKSKQQNISSFGDEFIIGKTDLKSNKYDIIVFSKCNIKSFIIPLFISAIGSNAFTYSDIENITITSQVKYIGEGAFSNCKHLKKVVFSNNSNLSIIYKKAFYNCIFEEIDIPPNVKEIGDDAFGGCKNLIEVNFIGDSKIDTIGKGAFSYTSIRNFTIPQMVKIIHEKTFENTPNLDHVETAENSVLQKIEDRAFKLSNITDLVLPASFKKFEDGWCENTQNLVYINFYEDNPIYMQYDEKYILGKSNPGSSTYDVIIYAYKDIKDPIIPPTIKKIASYAFCQTWIQKISIPSRVNEISEGSFSRCSLLTHVEIPDNSELTEIKMFSFFLSNIEKITIPPNVKRICNQAFSFCNNLKQIFIPNNSELCEIGEKAFFNSQIKNIFIPSHVKSINNYAFVNCKTIILIEIAEKCALNLLNLRIFSNSPKAIVMIPGDIIVYDADY